MDSEVLGEFLPEVEGVFFFFCVFKVDAVEEAPFDALARDVAPFEATDPEERLDEWAGDVADLLRSGPLALGDELLLPNVRKLEQRRALLPALEKPWFSLSQIGGRL